jgi:hypothetical protein
MVSLAKKSIGGDPEPPVQKGDGGYADYVIVALLGNQEYLDHPSRQLMDVLPEIPGIVEIFDLTVSELPDFMTVCTHK